MMQVAINVSAASTITATSKRHPIQRTDNEGADMLSRSLKVSIAICFVSVVVTIINIIIIAIRLS